MRKEQEMMNIILSIAKQDDRIRIVTIEGSHANINIAKDEFQDYDITYFVKDMEFFPPEEKGYEIVVDWSPSRIELYHPERGYIDYIL